MRHPFLAICLLALGLFVSCAALGPSGNRQSILVMSYNVLSLFDAIDDGNEYTDFSIAKGAWDEARYRTRLGRLAELILSLREGAGASASGPDISCLVEIEKESILADLVQGPLAKADFRYRAFAKAPGSPIGVGLLSRFPIVESKAWGLSFGERSERPILEARIATPGQELIVFVCHWKSKLEGAELTEASRRESAALLSSLAAVREAEYPAAAILACGDFNENPDEFVRVGRRYPTAFMPLASAEAAAAKAPAKAVFLRESGSDLRKEAGRASLWSPWSGPDSYSYVHRGVKERIDGFLLGSGFFDAKGLEFGSFYPFANEKIVDAAGIPISWSNSTGKGWSDHLPILLWLECVAASPSQ